MPAIGDLLATADLERLQRLGEQEEDTQDDLAAAAQHAASESAGRGRCAWMCVAIALDTTGSPDEAREAIAEMIQPGELRTLALACLATLTGTTAETP